MQQESSPKRYLYWAPPVLRVLGIAMLVIAIAVLVPATVPKFFGYELYTITSPSMTPAIPKDSLVVVQPNDPAALSEDDVAAFWQDESVIVHRVVNNQTFEGRLITKGDANEKEDVKPVPYQDVVGQVVFNVPIVGSFYGFLTDWVGKVYLACFALSGVLMCVLANQLAAKRKSYQNASE